jgi:uncharacterized protein involved in type VI secretion and phage assembly
MFVSPDLQRHAGRIYGKYSGEVADNADEEFMGRIKVRVPSVFGAGEVWARPCLPPGHFFVPPVGTRVWVEFEAGDPNFPIWVGVWYPRESAPEEAAVDPPESRVIHTPSGHIVQFSDDADDSKIIIRHKDNSFISLDKDGSVMIGNKNGSTLILNAKDGNLILLEEHGHVVTMDSAAVVIANKDGSAVELKGSEAKIIAPKIFLAGESVGLGASPAQQPTIMGTAFSALWTQFMTHTHATAMGPSGPPLPPAPLIDALHLTKAVTVS